MQKRTLIPVLLACMLMPTLIMAKEARKMADLSISSPAFAHTASIPERYTCDGRDINPPLLIEAVPPLEPGSLCRVEDADGRFVAIGYANPERSLAVRVLAWDDVDDVGALLRTRIRAAVMAAPGALCSLWQLTQLRSKLVRQVWGMWQVRQRLCWEGVPAVRAVPACLEWQPLQAEVPLKPQSASRWQFSQSLC